jgi:hypothetical protein
VHDVRLPFKKSSFCLSMRLGTVNGPTDEVARTVPESPEWQTTNRQRTNLVCL